METKETRQAQDVKMTDHSMSQSEPSQQSNDNSYKQKRKKRNNKPRGGAKG